MSESSWSEPLFEPLRSSSTRSSVVMTVVPRDDGAVPGALTAGTLTDGEVPVVTSGVLATEPAIEVTLLEGTLVSDVTVVSPTVMELGTESVELLEELFPASRLPTEGAGFSSAARSSPKFAAPAAVARARVPVMVPAMTAMRLRSMTTTVRPGVPGTR